MQSTKIEIINKAGLHARAASKLMELTSTFASDIQIGQDKMVDGKSILSLMMLAAVQGTMLNIVIDGQVTLTDRGDVEAVGIGLTAVAPTPVKATEAEAFLRGQTPDAETIAEAAKLAAGASSPTADRRGSVEYKRAMVRVLTGRALEKAVARAKGE